MGRKRVDALTGARRFPGSEWVHATFAGTRFPGDAPEHGAPARARPPRPHAAVEETYLLSDPQTSGGLLMFVPEAKAEALCDALRSAGEGGGGSAERSMRATSRCQRITVI